MNFCEALIGDWKAPIFTAITMQIAIWFRERQTRKTLLKNKKKQVATVLIGELKSLRDMYSLKRLKEGLPQDGPDIPVGFIGENYLAVYDHLIEKLGVLDDEDVVKLNAFYLNLKMLVDSLKILAERWERYVMFKRYPPIDKQRNEIEIEINIRYDDVCRTYLEAFDIQEKAMNGFDEIITMLEVYRK